MTSLRFRAWKTLTQKMIVLDPSGDEFNSYDLVEEDWWKVMQSTGLTDKNGVEIFEGDILKSCYNGNHSVEFKDGAFRIKHTEDCCKQWKGGLVSEVDNTDVVIGNIWQTPDLLPTPS